MSTNDRVITALAGRWPELGGDDPPPRAALAARLACTRWRVEAPAPGERYEHAIAQGRIPTREHSWHDAFNVRAFAEFPRAKAGLHARMAALPVHAGRRTRQADALALLDETALVIAGSSVSIAALERARADGSLAAIDELVRNGSLAVHVFGHALLEHRKLARPPIGAGVVTLALDAECSVDAALAEAIAADRFLAPAFAPTLPWPHPLVDAWVIATLASR